MASSPIKLIILLVTLGIINYVSCDIPVNCTYDEIVGEWLFYEGERKYDSSIECKNFTGPMNSVFKLQLHFPNLVTNDLGHKGQWTMVYNQGFEVVIDYRKYFAFSMYDQKTNGTTLSYCDLTFSGWSHDILGKNWACYYGERLNGGNEPKEYFAKNLERSITRLRHADTYARLINKLQTSWTAQAYPELSSMSYEDLLRKTGGLHSRVMSPPKPAPLDPTLKKYLLSLPEQLDWRDVDGVNFVSPVRLQGACGSCYAFSSLGMLESRLRIMTNNSVKVIFSPQDVVSCSEYAQGCSGGFPYVTAGKYAQDFGVVPEECYPYEGRDGECNQTSCKRYYVAEYNYVGGFFGGCNEELMLLDLVHYGPVTVAMQAYDDFLLYKSGIYHHTNIEVGFNPFHLVNHGVLIVGYGISNETGEKYWIVKNSWGEEWGENGFFKIRRGTNECNIESMAVSAIPIP